MSEYVRITDRKIELTDEGVEELMSDYTPTTEEVREGYSAEYDGCDCENCQYDRIAFDRWLAEVKAQAWDQCFESYVGPPNVEEMPNTYRNPYREEDSE